MKSLWLLALILLLVVGVAWLTREAFPKRVLVTGPIDTVWVPASPVTIKDTAEIKMLKIANSRLNLQNGIFKQQIHFLDSVYSDAMAKADSVDSLLALAAVLDTVLRPVMAEQRFPRADTLKVRYFFPPMNMWEVEMRYSPFPHVKEVVPDIQYIERSQFLGGWPERILYFVAGYGTKSLVDKVK